jgi:hypothetical protein
MKTPITELLESIDTIIGLLPDEALGAKNQAIIIRTKAESLLEKEKEIITEAFESGTAYAWADDSEYDANDYFAETFIHSNEAE